MSTINIAFSINDNYCYYVFFTISMIKKHNKNINVFVLTTDLSDVSKKKLKTLETENVTINFIDINKDKFTNLPLTMQGITVETYYRYLLPEVLPDLDKIIYLDSDLFINGDLRGIWDIDLEDYYLAGVNEIDLVNRFPEYKIKLGFNLEDLFINAGVLVFNLHKMRQDNISEHLFSETIRLKDTIRFQDQDVINLALKGKIAELPLAYNYTVEAMEKELLGLDEIKIIHYNSPGAKPWNLENYKNNKIAKFLRKWQQEFITIIKEHQQIEVSIIVSYYGEENQLEDVIEKIWSQTHKNIEIIIVDYSIEENIDKEKIKRKLEIEENKIKIIKVRDELDIQEEIKKQAKGKYIVNINHIDGIYNEFIEKVVETGEKNNSDIVLVENCRLDENNGNYYFFGSRFDDEILNKEIVKNAFNTSIKHKNYLTNNYCKLFKASYVKERNINFVRDFTIESYDTDKISYVKENLYVYRKIKEELVSVIVPVYNVEKYLVQCIDSIINQTYQNLEIILVNDGSTDNSGKICDEYAKKDSRIKVIHKENGGLSDARNKGLDFMTGEYVTLVDSDDYLEHNCIENLYIYAKTCQTAMSIGKFARFREDTGEFFFGDYQNSGDKIEMLTAEQCLEKNHKYFLDVFVTAWAKLYKTSLFNDSDPYKSIRYPIGVYHEDQYTTHKLFLKSKKIVFVNENLYVYRTREDSITSKPLSDKRIMDNIRGLEAKIIDFTLLDEDMKLLREHYVFYLNFYKDILEKYQKQNSEVYEYIQKCLVTHSHWK